MGHLSQWPLLLVPAVKEKLILLPQWTETKLDPFSFHLVKIIGDAR